MQYVRVCFCVCLVSHNMHRWRCICFIADNVVYGLDDDISLHQQMFMAEPNSLVRDMVINCLEAV
jgi:hypothetical protein